MEDGRRGLRRGGRALIIIAQDGSSGTQVGDLGRVWRRGRWLVVVRGVVTWAEREGGEQGTDEGREGS